MRARYVPDLCRLGALCEANYLRMEQLTRLADGASPVQFELRRGERYLGRVCFRRIQESRYTDTWMLEQLHNVGRWLNNPRMTVRRYHDARMVEVISCFRHHRVEPVRDYPNRFMHHRDEKVQINAFLADWLGFCLRHGHVPDSEPLWLAGTSPSR